MDRIWVFHDHFMYRWGWERLITLLAKSIDADLISGFFDEWSLDPREVWFKWKIIEITKPWFAFFDKHSYQLVKKKDYKVSRFRLILLKWLRHLALKYAILFKTKVLKDYDVVVFSWDALWAVRNCRKDAKKVYYCHTPPRYLYDQKDVYLSKVPSILKVPYLVACFIFRKAYERDFSKFDIILTNSKNVQERIRKYLWRESVIVYPPVDISFFKPSFERKDYYFSWARLTEIKRVDRIAKAFIEMPEKNLIISYWKNDPEKARILKMVKWYKNISTIEAPDDETLRKLIWESIATVFIPVDEDFWMTPVESIACWVPVIWVNDWWVKEIILDWITGILIDKDANIEDIKSAVSELDIGHSIKMKKSCIDRAKLFSLDAFEENIKKHIFKN